MRKTFSLALVLMLILTTVGCNGGKTVSENISSNLSSVIETSSDVSSTVSEEEKVLPTKEQILKGEDPELYDLSVDQVGNKARLATLMKKAEKGGSYVIGAIGGSITQGAGADGEKYRYVNHIFSWWKENFPKATFTLVNAGIGSSNSEMACNRIDKDLLRYKPDFVVVDFSVNTYLDDDSLNTYQTLLYKIMSQPNNPAVMSVHFTATVLADYQSGKAVRANEYPNDNIKAAIKKYDVPSINYDKYVWTRIDQRTIRWNNIGADYIHPGNRGHELTGYMFKAYLDKVKANLANESTAIPALPKLDTEKYLKIEYITNDVGGVQMNGFTKNDNSNIQKNGWNYSAKNGAASLTVPLPKNTKVSLLLWNSSDATGKITVKGANGKTETQEIKIKGNHVLMHCSAMGDSVTVIPSLTSGEFSILGIGVTK